MSKAKDTKNKIEKTLGSKEENIDIELEKILNENPT